MKIRKRNQVSGKIQIKRIDRYLRALSPAIVGTEVIDSVEILEVKPGTYNLNYHVRVNSREFMFRINIDQQSGLPHQVEYEYNTLKTLENLDIAPKALHIDNSKQFFDFGILIEEYLDGSHLSLEKREMKEVAELLVRLHSLKLDDTQFVVWRDPLVDTYKLARNDLMLYETKRTAKIKTIELTRKLLAEAETYLATYRLYYKPEALNHTDVVCDNLIKTPKGLRLIDWEKPRIDDCTYDLCCFLSEPSQLWCSEKVLNSMAKEDFLQTYASLKGKDLDLLKKKYKLGNL